MKKKAFLIFLIMLTILSATFTGTAAPLYMPEAPFTAKAVYLYNIDTGAVISEQNSTQPMYPASLTKIMTCILALENTGDLDFETVTFPQYVQDYLYTYQLQNGGVSLGGLSANEEISMRKLLYALMLPSANEAAMMIANHLAGSQEAFAEMMNRRAKELGATNTHFVNANGLFDENHTTTAEDMAKIALHAMSLPGFMDITSTISFDSGETNKHDNLHWESTNLMMMPENSYYYPGLRGIKTGSLPESGRCFISTATKNGFTYLLVIMGSDYYDAEGNVLPGNKAFDDTRVFYDWVFASYKVKTLVEKGKIVAEIPLRLSMDKDFVKLMTDDRFTKLMNTNIEASSVVIVPEVPDSLDAPVKKGDVVGEAKLMLSGEEVGRVKLLASESVEASQLLILWEKVKEIMRSFWFKFAVVFIVSLIISYIIMMILRNRRRRRSGYKGRRRL